MKVSLEFGQYLIIDEDVISQLRELEDPSDATSFVDDLILIFRREAPLAIRGLQEAFSKSDQRGLVYWSHKLKGLCRNLGARRLSEVCNSIEHTANPPNMSDLLRLIELAQVELDEAFRLLFEHMTDKAA